MANEGTFNFDEFLRKASNYDGGEPDYFEDTHDSDGRYTGRRRPPEQSSYEPPRQAPFSGMPDYTPPPTASAARTEDALARPPVFDSKNAPREDGTIPLPGTEQFISRQLNQKFVIYQPRTIADVEKLISYLKRLEPALVDLDPIADSPDAQRFMDFTAGAAFALGETVMTVRRNLFLITPDTMAVLKSDEEGNR